MSETKHTPGPWKASYDRYERKHSFVGDGMWFGKISWTVTSDRNEADARLIAAAPELLEALKLFVRAEKMARDGNPPQDADELIKLGDSAIAKAEGRS
jgi:hypothetical protein